MEMNKQEYKALKKAYKREKRRKVTPWKGMTILCLILALICTPLILAMQVFDNTLAAFVGGTFWELQDEDPHAQYFRPDFDSVEEMTDAGLALCREVEAEGAVLLMNNGALPLASGAKVSTLSSSSVNLVYGGTGSGNVDASKADDLKTALEKSGLEVNPILWDWYQSEEGAVYNRTAGSGESAVLAGQASIAEVPVDVYPQKVKDSFAQYGDAVIITLSRVGGEGYDLEFRSYNYLALSQEEQDMLRWAADMKKAGTVKHIVVLINTSNALQVDFLKDNPYDVDACLWIGGVGISGTNAVADILAGKVNPSGRLVDTYCFDNYSAPAMANFVPVTYGGDTSRIPSSADTYMVYQEGIYVGYKYYETRYEDYVMGTGNAGTYAYGEQVAFPFGYGLSYTKFAYSDMAVAYEKETDQFQVTVTVTNAGDVPGKHTVQVYSQSPYTDYDKTHGVEKASVALCGFGKTGMMAPGESRTMTITVDKRDLASFDTDGAGTYILDAGTYYLALGRDAHDAVNNTLAAKGYTVENTQGRMDAQGDSSLVYAWEQETLDTVTYATSLNGTPITQQLSDADINLNDAVETTVTYLSRSDWEGTWPSRTVQINLNDKLVKALQDVLYDPADYLPVTMPRMGADNGLRLVDMIGLDYDDPQWELLLDQLTFDEMVSAIGDSFHWRMPLESIQAPGTRDENGPQGLTASLIGSDASQMDATAFTSEDVMAATFNTELLYQVGNMIGNNCLHADVVCLYGPGANTHRTPYGGRNFEYYAEDGFLAGEICGAEVQGIQEKGVDVVIKHFALNDCEQDRLGQAAWIGEQAAREIYLKAFQKALEEAGGNGVMTAYTRWGTTWSGGHKGLMTGIMREEWGNQGMTITDNVLVNYVNGVDGVMAGGVTTYDAMLWYVTAQLPEYEQDAVVVTAMREACHHNLYALANSSGMNGVGANTTIVAHELVLISIMMIFACAFWFFTLVGAGLWIWGVIRLRKTEAYQAFRAAKKARKQRS